MQEYEKYIVKQDYYKYGNGPRSYYSFPANALHVDRYSYKNSIAHLRRNLCEDFTPKMQTMIEDFFDDNPRCQYCVVKDVRFFYKNIVMRKLMTLYDNTRLYNSKNKFSFTITKIEEASKSSCTLNIRERKPIYNKRSIAKIQRELFTELAKLNVKAKIIKELTSKDTYSLKVLVSRK